MQTWWKWSPKRKMWESIQLSPVVRTRMRKSRILGTVTKYLPHTIHLTQMGPLPQRIPAPKLNPESPPRSYQLPRKLRWNQTIRTELKNQRNRNNRRPHNIIRNQHDWSTHSNCFRPKARPNSFQQLFVLATRKQWITVFQDFSVSSTRETSSRPLVITNLEASSPVTTITSGSNTRWSFNAREGVLPCLWSISTGQFWYDSV